MAGFKLDGVEYEWPQSFRLGDPVLIREVTGLDWQEFVTLAERGDGDPSVVAGLIAASVWQANPKWSRERVRSLVEQADLDSLDVSEEGEPDDPPVAEEAPPSATSPEAFTVELAVE